MWVCTRLREIELWVCSRSRDFVIERLFKRMSALLLVWYVRDSLVKVASVVDPLYVFVIVQDRNIDGRFNLKDPTNRLHATVACWCDMYGVLPWNWVRRSIPCISFCHHSMLVLIVRLFSKIAQSRVTYQHLRLSVGPSYLSKVYIRSNFVRYFQI